MLEKSTSQVEQLNLKVLKILLIVGTCAWALFAVIEAVTGVISAFDVYAYPILFVYYFFITIFIHLYPKFRIEVSVATITGLALYMAICHWLYYLSPASASLQELSFQQARIVQWYVLIFISSFIFFEPKSAIVASVIFYLSLAIPEIIFLFSDHQRDEQVTATTLISLISNPVYIVCLWGVTLLKEHAYRAEDQASVMAKAALQDNLTFALNRRGAQAFIDDFQQRLSQENWCCGLILFDLDYFKLINDRHGHDVGDEALIELVKLTQSQLRTVDALSRWGGEEFLVILPNATLENTANLAERLRTSLERKNEGVLTEVTASFGVSLLTDANSFQQTLKNADKALYQAKANGRNQVAISQS